MRSWSLAMISVSTRDDLCLDVRTRSGSDQQICQYEVVTRENPVSVNAIVVQDPSGEKQCCLPSAKP